MKKLLSICACFALFSTNGIADDRLAFNTPLKLDFQNVLKLVKENLNGWTKLQFDRDRTLWTPHSFYTERISDPKQWISQIRELGFCQPDKVWKSFPVLSISNDDISSNFEQVAMNPQLNLTTQMMYSETVIVGGKARNVSYDYAQNGGAVKITCSARNELGDVQTIQQNIDVRNPKNFSVEQRKNGKLLEI